MLLLTILVTMSDITIDSKSFDSIVSALSNEDLHSVVQKKYLIIDKDGLIRKTNVFRHLFEKFCGVFKFQNMCDSKLIKYSIIQLIEFGGSHNLINNGNIEQIRKLAQLAHLISQADVPSDPVFTNDNLSTPEKIAQAFKTSGSYAEQYRKANEQTLRKYTPFLPHYQPPLEMTISATTSAPYKKIRRNEPANDLEFKPISSEQNASFMQLINEEEMAGQEVSIEEPPLPLQMTISAATSASYEKMRQEEAASDLEFIPTSLTKHSFSIITLKSEREEKGTEIIIEEKKVPEGEKTEEIKKELPVNISESIKTVQTIKALSIGSLALLGMAFAYFISRDTVSGTKGNETSSSLTSTSAPFSLQISTDLTFLTPAAPLMIESGDSKAPSREKLPTPVPTPRDEHTGRWESGSFYICFRKSFLYSI